MMCKRMVMVDWPSTSQNLPRLCIMLDQCVLWYSGAGPGRSLPPLCQHCPGSNNGQLWSLLHCNCQWKLCVLATKEYLTKLSFSIVYPQALQLEHESEKYLKDMERIRQTNAELNLKIRQVETENKNLEQVGLFIWFYYHVIHYLVDVVSPTWDKKFSPFKNGIEDP